MSTVITGMAVIDPVVPAVITPLAKSMIGPMPPVLVTRPAVPLTDTTYPKLDKSDVVSARKVGAAGDPDAGPANTKFDVVKATPVPPRLTAS